MNAHESAKNPMPRPRYSKSILSSVVRWIDDLDPCTSFRSVRRWGAAARATELPDARRVSDADRRPYESAQYLRGVHGCSCPREHRPCHRTTTEPAALFGPFPGPDIASCSNPGMQAAMPRGLEERLQSESSLACFMPSTF